MSIYPVTASGAYGVSARDTSSSNSSSNSSGANSTAQDYNSMYMQLLSTELQSQDPTQSVDPTTMVTQMVQINELSDVAGIYSMLQTQLGASSSASGSAGSAAAQSNIAHPSHNTIGGN